MNVMFLASPFRTPLVFYGSLYLYTCQSVRERESWHGSFERRVERVEVERVSSTGCRSWQTNRPVLYLLYLYIG